MPTSYYYVCAAHASAAGKYLKCLPVPAQVPRQFSEEHDPGFDVGLITLDANATGIAHFVLPPGQDAAPRPVPPAPQGPGGAMASSTAPAPLAPDLALVPLVPGEASNSRWAQQQGGPWSSQGALLRCTPPVTTMCPNSSVQWSDLLGCCPSYPGRLTIWPCHMQCGVHCVIVAAGVSNASYVHRSEAFKA